MNLFLIIIYNLNKFLYYNWLFIYYYFLWIVPLFIFYLYIYICIIMYRQLLCNLRKMLSHNNIIEMNIIQGNLHFTFFSLFPIWGRCIEFSFSTFFGIALLVSVHLSPLCLFVQHHYASVSGVLLFDWYLQERGSRRVSDPVRCRHHQPRECPDDSRCCEYLTSLPHGHSADTFCVILLISIVSFCR